MALSWENVANGAWHGEASSIEFFTIGPIQGPSVITNIVLNAVSRGFTIKRFAYSISHSKEATQANFDQGTKLIRPLLDSTGGTTQPEIFFSTNGSVGWSIDLPVWYNVTSKPVYLVVSVLAQVGSSLIDCIISVLARHLWDAPAGKSPLRSFNRGKP